MDYRRSKNRFMVEIRFSDHCFREESRKDKTFTPHDIANALEAIVKRIRLTAQLDPPTVPPPSRGRG